jgi:hypothetical protein
VMSRPTRGAVSEYESETFDQLRGDSKSRLYQGVDGLRGAGRDSNGSQCQR